MQIIERRRMASITFIRRFKFSFVFCGRVLLIAARRTKYPRRSISNPNTTAPMIKFAAGYLLRMPSVALP